ncbi:MAG: hypothetical protein Q9198_002232 [Flavoplaca austrocitrina]
MGKFGFHIPTCHAKIAQKVDSWEDSWCTLYSNHLGYVMDLAKPILQWPEFDVVCRLTLEKVVPRLLLPLQSEGRVLKPCLIHGNCWDGNTAMDIRTGEAFVFDVCSFYGHNEYDTGNWRAPRHRLSNKAYIRNYKKAFPVSEPGTPAILVYDDMTTLCKMFCASDLDQALKALQEDTKGDCDQEQATAGAKECGSGEEEEEEEEEEDVI